MEIMNEQDWTKAFMNRLKRLMKEQHFTNGQMANLIRVGENTMINYRTGKCLPNLYTAAKIAKVLNVKLDELASLDFLDEFEMAGFSEEECVELRKLSEKYNIEPSVLIHAVQYMDAGTKKYTALDKLLEMSGGKEMTE